MKYPLVIIVLSVFLLTQCKSSPKESEIETEPDEQEIEMYHTGQTLPVTTFREVWGYVLAGRESDLKKNIPLTDIGYFGMEVDIYGSLTKVPTRQNLSAFGGR